MQSHQDPETRAPNDPELVAACKGGSLEAYEQLYRLYEPYMKSIAYHFLRNTSDAEDAVQEAFLKIYRGMGCFQGEAAFSTWCYRILLNTCYDMMRQKRKLPTNPAGERQREDLAALAGTMDSDHPLRLTLDRCLQELSLRKRTVFLLFEIEGFTHREIAGLLDIPEGTSRTLLFDAKKDLQKALWQASIGRRT